MLAVGAIAVAGCGGNTKTFANRTPPPVPVNLTVYINNARVSVSPVSVGAGPVTFIVANHASSSQAVMISSGGQVVAKTGPINPQGTASVNVALTQQGQYRVSTGSGATTEASTASPTGSIAPATVTVGPTRGNSRGDLNLP